MKSKLYAISFSVMFFHISFLCFPQSYPFPQPGTEQGIVTISDWTQGSKIGKFYMRYKSDTLLCGKTYHAFVSYADTIVFYTRYDNGKIYYTMNCLYGEELKYDFNLSVGDSFQTTGSFYNSFLVDSVYFTTMQNGQSRKTIRLSIGNKKFYWVDGIGDIDNGFYYYADWEGGAHQFVCHKDSSGMVLDSSASSVFPCEIVTNRDSTLRIKLTPSVYYGGYNISSKNASDGSVTSLVLGGLYPYQYNWSNGSSSKDIKNLKAGTYTLEVVDFNNDTVIASVTLTEPGISLLLLQTGTTTCKSCDGSATATASGGMSPYTYTWNSTPPIYNDTIAGLCAGKYTVSVIDFTGQKASGPISVKQPANNLSGSIYGSSGTCSSQSNAGIYVYGGIKPYSFLWVPTGDTTDKINNINSGEHCVRVTDSTSCFIEKCITIGALYESIPVVKNSKQDVKCFGDCTGSATAIVGGSCAPYTYWWSTGSTTSSTSNLCAGYYTVTVASCYGCKEIQTIFIGQPFAIVPVVYSNGDTLYTDPASTYQWYLDSTIIAGAINKFYLPLLPGNYTVKITDSSGCSGISQPYNLVSVPNRSYFLDLKIFHNPETGKISLSFDLPTETDIQIEIFNILGSHLIIPENQIRHGGVFFKEIDTNGMPTGIYFVRVIINESYVFSKKTVVTR